MRAILSILGLYNFDPTLFDDMEIPTDIDKDILVDNICLECNELEVIYPDAPFMKKAIKAWSKKEIDVWNKLVDTTKFEYNPIWNKQANISDITIETRNLTQSHNETGTTNATNSQTGSTITDQDTSDNTTNSVSAYNSSNYQPKDKSESTGTNDVTVTDTASNTSNGGHSINSIDGDTGTIRHDNTHTEEGNIGVTSTQELIKQEREIDLFNVYDVIIQSFKNRFCLLVY